MRVRSIFGPQEAVFAMQIIIHHCRNINYEAYVCFLDYAKTFGKFNQEKMASQLMTTSNLQKTSYQPLIGSEKEHELSE